MQLPLGLHPFRLLTLSCLLFITVPLFGLTYQNREYIELSKVGASFGMKAFWIEKGKSIRLKSEWTSIDFEKHQREITLNDIRVFLGDPIIERKGRLYLSELDLEKTLQPILTPQVFSPIPKLYRIVIDPGHGGKDPGTENKALRLQEKHLSLSLSEMVKASLESLGYQVILTRSKDEFIELNDRAAFANKQNADLFISLHFNATGNNQVQGIETYAFTPQYQPSTSRAKLTQSDKKNYPGNKNDSWNVLLGYYIQKELLETTRNQKDRGLKRARFNVLREVHMPGILVEGGFLTHPQEGRNIGSAAYRDKLAKGIVQGVLRYQKTLTRLKK